MNNNINIFFKKIVQWHAVPLIKLLAFFSIYFFTARVGLEFDAVSGFASLVWPPSGIAIAGIIFLGYRYAPAVFFGAFLVNFISGAPILAALGIGLGNTIEAAGGVYAAKKFGFVKEATSLKNIFLFIVFCVLANTAIAATIGTTSLWLAGTVSSLAYKSTWTAWWVGDMLGALVVGNLIITLFGIKWTWNHFKTRKFVEKIIFLIILVIYNLLIFTSFFGAQISGANSPTLVYTIFPLLIWAALRFGRLGAALSVFITSAISILGTVLGKGHFATGELSYNLLALQGYIIVIAATSAILAAFIEERSQTESDLMNEKNKDEAILESIGEGVIVIDANDVILMINNSAQAMLGLNAHDTVGHYFEKTVPIENQTGILLPSEKRPCMIVLSSNKVMTDTYYFRTRNGKLPVTMTTAPIVFEQKVVGIINVFRDITHELEVDKAKSEFVSLASHQLRTPLTTIKWYTRALMRENTENLSKKQLEYLNEMYHNNERMIELVNSLLNVSRIELGKFNIKPVPLNIYEIADEIVHDIEPYATTKNIEIKKQYDDHLPSIKADPNLIKIILQNLLDNSIKYSKEHSYVRFRIKNKEKEIWFIVSDTGCGIAKNQQDKIFTKMFRAENARMIDPEGNGLGLYIIKSIVEQSGGRIWFTSEIKKGTTFYISLPIMGMIRRERGAKLNYSQTL